mmetsp:Transcript_8371/g.24579  ORF Transcript_8371/g.24579 Transcript_8371/m.24579 type:complete len:225 (+) Transcript_8371:151-825(+)
MVVLVASAGTLLFENDRMRITDFRLPPGTSGGLAEHEYPTIRWQVGDGVQQMLDSESGEVGVPTATPDKNVFWVDAGQSFLCTNAHASEEYRQVCWAFKQPPRRTDEEVRQLLDGAIYTTDVGTARLFENRYCRVWDFYLDPGEGDLAKPHHHVLDYCFCYVAPGRLLGSHHDGTPGLFDSVNEDGDVTWFDIPDSAPEDPHYAHGGRNGYDDRPMREYLVELK